MKRKLLVQYMESSRITCCELWQWCTCYQECRLRSGTYCADRVTIIDIRSEADFEDGHIEGAVNLAPGAVRATLMVWTQRYNEISIVCYTGQTASWLTSLLQLAGYKNVYSMTCGMSGWAELSTNGPLILPRSEPLLYQVSPKGAED